MPPSSSVKKTLSEIRSFIDKKEFARAIQSAENVLKKDSSNYHAHVFIGVAAVAQHDFQRALDSYHSAIKLRPELPLAYKGLIQTLTKPDAPHHPLDLARAYFSLGSLSADHACDALPKAAEAFFTLALEEHDVRKEAVSSLQFIQSSDICSFPTSYSDSVTYRICKILSLDLPRHENSSESGESIERLRYEALTSSPFSQSLDTLITVLYRNNDPTFYDGTAQLVIERACENCLRNVDFSTNLYVLRHLHAYEQLLCVSEADHSPSFIPKDERVLFALRNKHLRPFEIGKSRTTCVFATVLRDATGDSDEAIGLASASKRPEPASSIVGIAARKQTVPKFLSCTHAFTAAFLHFTREEYKLAIDACRSGLAIASKSNYLKKMHMVFSLLLGASLREDRKYKEAAREFETVRVNGQKIEDPWLTHAAHRGLITNAVSGYGRRSRAASTALEEAASSEVSRNDYGLVESFWSDALSGDVDVDRMEELVSRIVNELRSKDHEKDDLGCWEYGLLSPHLTVSRAQLAALASSRLGQMRLAAEGYTESSLKMAQKDQMSAAGFVKGEAEPFAHLGFIMEQLAKIHDKDKMLLRASRCYERALATDSTNPLASRQLVRILTDRGLHSEAYQIARKVSDRNPKARWAFNILGWWRLSRERYSEATVAFLAALRGRPKRTPREDDALFGTDVGCTANDNDLLVDIDSWRGLSVAYHMQGRLGAASACLDDALVLLEKPPSLYISNAKYDVAKLISTCRDSVESERDVLTVLSRKSAQVGTLARSMLERSQKRDQNVDSSGLAVGYYAAEALMVSAAEEWVRGAYRRATEMREQAALLFNEWNVRQMNGMTHLKHSVLFKRLGDMWSEAAGGDCSPDLACLVSQDSIANYLDKASLAYSKAAHLTPWEKPHRVHDLAAILQRKAMFESDPAIAKMALNLLLHTDSYAEYAVDADESNDACLLALAFVTYASFSTDRNLKYEAVKLAGDARRRSRWNAQKLILDASIAMSIEQLTHNSTTNSNSSTDHTHSNDLGADMSEYAEAAIRATRVDPTDWRGFLAVAKVREADTRIHPRDMDRLHSCEQAYAEADRLGAGPIAVCGRLRCRSLILEELREAKDNSMYYESEEKLFQEACYVESLAKRAGKDIPHVCTDIIHEYVAKRNEEAKLVSGELAQSSQGNGVKIQADNSCDTDRVNQIWRHVHMYPYLPATRELLSSFTFATACSA